MHCQVDPLWVDQPDFFKVICQIHVFFIKPMYVIILLSYLIGARRIARAFTLFAAPALLYSMILVFSLGFLGPEQYRVREPQLWWKFNGDYFVVPALAWARYALTGSAKAAPVAAADRKQR